MFAQWVTAHAHGAVLGGVDAVCRVLRFEVWEMVA